MAWQQTGEIPACELLMVEFTDSHLNYVASMNQQCTFTWTILVIHNSQVLHGPEELFFVTN